MTNTTDKKLAEYLNTEVKLMELELVEINKSYGDAVYVLYVFISEDNEDQQMGIYKNFSDAKQIGIRSGKKFWIERNRVRTLSEDEIEKYGQQLKEDEWINMTDLMVYYNKENEVCIIDYRPGDDNEEYTALSQDRDFDMYFENTVYKDIPCLYKNGDLVKNLNDGRIGIIHVDADREEWVKKMLSKGIVPDEEEFCEFPDEDGEFSHQHCLSSNLDPASIDEVPEEMRLVMECAAALIQGKGSIDEVQYSIYDMKRKRGQK